MSLLNLVDNSRTDKNTTHSYLHLYDVLLGRLQDKAKNVMEIGVGAGGSILLWKNFFPNAQVYALDILPRHALPGDLFTDNRITTIINTNAYDYDFFKRNFLDKGIQFDYMLDDGPHTTESVVDFVKLYSQLMTADGILIVEDVQSMDVIPLLREATPEHLRQFIKVYDLRQNKQRYDDIVFTIDKRNAT
jgi:hypothetical protein